MRYGRLFVILVLFLAALGGGAALGLRGGRNKVGTPATLKPGFMLVTNAMNIGVFAARVAPGPHVIFFDAGLDPGGKPIDALLSSLGASRDDVTDVFVTHGHFDHVAGLPVLSKAKVHLGAADVPLAEQKIQPDGLLAMTFGKIVANPPVAANAPLTGPAAFPVGSSDPAKLVKAFPVPGHTPGSYAFLYDGVLLVGDIMVLSQGRLEPTPRVFNPHPDENKKSIISLKSQLANENVDVVCTSHGGCTPKGLGKNLLDELVSRLGG
jgi:glyoxylase-like metal-dependent hydrolase (beta-lactamase superfamily II)